MRVAIIAFALLVAAGCKTEPDRPHLAPRVVFDGWQEGTTSYYNNTNWAYGWVRNIGTATAFWISVDGENGPSRLYSDQRGEFVQRAVFHVDSIGTPGRWMHPDSCGVIRWMDHH